MNYDTREQVDQNVAVDLDGTELDSIAIRMQVRSGIRAGIQPCL